MWYQNRACAGQDVVPEQCRTRCGTTTGSGPLLPSVCLSVVSPLMACVRKWDFVVSPLMPCVRMCGFVVSPLMPCVRKWAFIVSTLMPCVGQDVVPEQEVGHSFRLFVVSPLMPCAGQDVVPEHEVGYSFRLFVCCFPFNVLCRSRCGTRTGSRLQLLSVCLLFPL